jgi:dephospho-CoA kinase
MNLSNAIALTGGISTGKSSVCSILKLHGFSIIDADTVAHDVVDNNVDKVKELFPDCVEDGEVDRESLAKLIFNLKSAKKKLEDLTHPLIKEEILKQAQKLEQHNVPYFIDIPLFYETKSYDIPKVVVVYAPASTQIQRLTERDGINKYYAQKKLDNQMDIEEKKKLATFVIDNSSDIKHLQDEVEKLVAQIKS